MATQSISVIIPAFNEARRLPAVLDALRQASGIDEIIVVDDGSTDDTAQVAETCGVRTLRLPENHGKGSAMRAGALAAANDLLLFLDADLHGLKPDQVNALIHPVLRGETDMSVGIFRGGRTITDLAHLLSPTLSGQRCLRRDFFLSIPLIEGSRSGVEIVLTAHARACRLTLRQVPLEGITHTMKEEKIGLLRGLWARAGMYADILTTALRYRLAVRLPGRAPLGTK